MRFLMIFKRKVIFELPRLILGCMKHLASIMLFQPEFQIFSDSDVKTSGFEQAFKDINVQHMLLQSAFAQVGYGVTASL